ncbi:hypothetical protein F5X68DRAFT_212030 [Plectosphaerella plurivora]|uniref:Pentatricopeptide repeat-containing protein n=1 Tax=Plectosphaerella plurivora TaxID=936078 RepID=A0A9P8V7W4_9PEZI|nr:hypothetical protein F5X68DRAFT_212030 [Plectosphaerella plurivora]
MLERTAARLEPCTLPRSWPSTVRTQRNLHTGFWQHGAAALDLSSIWTTSSGQAPPQRDATVPSERGLPERLLTSAFLLDFLYPKGTVAFLRRLTPAAIDRFATAVARQPAGPSRLYSSSAARGVADPAEMSFLVENSVSNRSKLADQAKLTDQPPAGQLLLQKKTKTAAEREQFLARLQVVVDPDEVHGAAMTPVHLMRGLMARTDTEFYDAVWDLWLMLEPQEKIDSRKDVLKYFHHSLNPVDAARVLDIFSEVDLVSWSPSQMTAAVAAHLRRGDLEDALQVYETGLGLYKRGLPGIETPLVGGMGHLFHYAMRGSNWELVTRIYDPWQEIFSSRTEYLGWGVLTPIFSVPNLGGRVLDFRERLSPTVIDEDTQFLAEDMDPEPGVEGEDALPNLYPNKTPEERLEHCRPLLNILAKLAIQQACKPSDARPLLQIINKGNWHRQYIIDALARGDTKAISEVYREYRQMPAKHFRPSKETLTSILQVFVPHDVQGVEMVYEDFHRLHGGPSVLACVQFLTFYSRRGDLESTQRVWDALVAEDKEALTKPSTFAPLLVAHRSRGDAKAVRQLFDELPTQYGVEPDVRCWNVLLSSVTDQGNIADALTTFGQLRKAVNPSSVSFGIIMNMIARRGDLELTLLLFEDAKKSGVAIDVGLLSTVTEAYARAGDFDEARRICVAAKVDGMPGDLAKLWNCLIRRKAHQRDLRKVRAVIEEMKRRKIPWNSETQESVLQAICQAKRVTEAYNLLHRPKDLAVTARHFSIVIEGARLVKAWRLVLALCAQMEQAGFLVHGPNLIARAEAEAATTLTMGGDEEDANREMSRELVEEFRDMLQADTLQQELPLTTETAMYRKTGDIVSDKTWTEFVQKAVKSLAQVPDLPAIRELLGMYIDAVAATGKSVLPQDLPLPILESMMQADLLAGDYAQVKETWKFVLAKARVEGLSHLEPGLILLTWKYRLAVPLDIMHEIQHDEKDPAAMMALIDEVQAAGFALNSINWNRTCLRLAKLGHWVKACLIFEELLMPNWTGWRAMRLMPTSSKVPYRAPFHQRLSGRSAEFLRPNSETLTFLTDEYHWMRRAAQWDTSYEKMLRTVAAKCPKMMHAFRTALGHANDSLIKSHLHQDRGIVPQHQQLSSEKEREAFIDDNW